MSHGSDGSLNVSGSSPLKELSYLAGFGNEHASEAVVGALPVFGNNPQKAPMGLYAEQLSGTAFTVPRVRNRRTWLYRVRPSVVSEAYVSAPNPRVRGSFGKGGGGSGGRSVGSSSSGVLTPNQLRWLPAPLPLPKAGGGDGECDWLAGLTTLAGAGSADTKEGLAIHMWACNVSMVDAAFGNADGEMLIIPQEGGITLQTEMGWLGVACGEFVVVPRGVRFRVIVEGPSRGYVLEVFAASPFILPELGVIGSNGLAAARDFLYPTAAYDAARGPTAPPFHLTTKFGGDMWSTTQAHSPFDVVAWHGNHAPYKYDMARFNVIGSISYDHPDPSIFTLLTCPSDTMPGVAIADFVIFPPRWMVAEKTFRPPWFHRNW